ncbi:PQQ-binding-like beta-propeller repeat protein [Arthrobacter castelli]|uniref:outer membrane protein assembly factor BamB family protein n=1 Tax=Arthrobacter castelli TaxID=271431 RepID=UPI00040E65BE|nr:PQQ-binding-like beta-propeller repeat protein [Arthrobacter castelli]
MPTPQHRRTPRLARAIAMAGSLLATAATLTAAAPATAADHSKADGDRTHHRKELAGFGDWTSNGGGPDNRFWNRAEFHITVDTVDQLSPAYHVTTPLKPVGEPIVAGGRVYQLHESGVAAYDTDDGDVLWKIRLDSTPTDIAFSQGMVYLSTGSLGETSTLYAIEADGDRQWSNSARDIHFDQLLAANGRVAVSGSARGGGPHRVEVFRSDGSLAWTRDDAEIAPKSPMVDPSGRIYLRPWNKWSPKHETVAVSLQTGLNQGHIDRPLQPRTTLPFTGHVLAMEDIGVIHHRAMSIDTTTGNIFWEKETPWFASEATAAVNDSHIYLAETNDDLNVSALRSWEQDSGRLSWRTRLPEGADMGDPVVAGGLVYLRVSEGGSESHLYAYRTSDGHKVWSHPVDPRSWMQHPVISHGTLYMRTADGFAALRPE